jgi:hypothetical protein
LKSSYEEGNAKRILVLIYGFMGCLIRLDGKDGQDAGVAFLRVDGFFLNQLTGMACIA